MQSQHIWISIMLWGTAACAHGQWLNHPMPGTPRTRDGKPNLSARAPRASNGKPDLSGVWVAESATREELLLFFSDGANALGETPPSKYFMNILYDFNPKRRPCGPRQRRSPRNAGRA